MGSSIGCGTTTEGVRMAIASRLLNHEHRLKLGATTEISKVGAASQQASNPRISAR
ncbi:MAG: hypothetical protein OCD00_00410 [Colwellia sp.]